MVPQEGGPLALVDDELGEAVVPGVLVGFGDYPGWGSVSEGSRFGEEKSGSEEGRRRKEGGGEGRDAPGESEIPR